MSSTLAAHVNDDTRRRTPVVSEFVEVPASPPHGDHEPNEDRIARVKQRVEEIYALTKGNPADGRWALMSSTLRLGVTSGRNQHWIGTRKDLKPPKEHQEVPWINADTELEWTQWEKRASMVDKVKNWNRRVEESSSLAEPVDPLSAAPSQPPRSQEIPKAQVSITSTPIDPLDEPTPLGFSVVKRATKTTAKGKPAGPMHSQRSARKGSMGPPPINNSKLSSKSNKTNQPPEPSFPAPSFSASQILTSTPKPGASARPTSQPSQSFEDLLPPATPILPNRPATPPPPASIAAPLHNSQSLPAIPIMPRTPTRPKQTFSTSNLLNANKKRIHELEDIHAQKKARLADPPATATTSQPKSPIPPVVEPSTPLQAESEISYRFMPDMSNPLFADEAPEAPSTPPKKTKPLPTLTELLASSRKNKNAKKAARLTPKHVMTKPSIKGKEKEVVYDDEPYSGSDGIARAQSHPSVPEAQVLDNSFPSSAGPADIDEDNPYMLNPNAIHDHDNPADDIDLLLTTKDLDVSPTKSLSSIADSDEEDEDDDPRSPPVESSPIVGTFSFNPAGFEFNPQAASTQNHYAPFSALHTSPGAPPVDQSFNFLGGSFPFRSSQASSPGSNKGPGPAGSARYAQYRSKQGEESQAGVPNSMDSWASVYKHRTFQYNSQLQSNIAKQVDQVDKLLEKDVDYEGWLKDPSVESEEGGDGLPQSSP